MDLEQQCFEAYVQVVDFVDQIVEDQLATF
jgi:hypothetical protein